MNFFNLFKLMFTHIVNYSSVKWIILLYCLFWATCDISFLYILYKNAKWFFICQLYLVIMGLMLCIIFYLKEKNNIPEQDKIKFRAMLYTLCTLMLLLLHCLIYGIVENPHKIMLIILDWNKGLFAIGLLCLLIYRGKILNK